MVTSLCKKDIKTNKLPARISSSLQRKLALADADYIINCTRIGGLEAFELDIDIPLKYGVDQCVGDTLCIKPGTPHHIKNTGTTPLHILCMCSPPYSHEDTELL